MTPGYAKPRSELPWLPYEENDRVIINSHNFEPATWSPSVNGKTPVSAWVPSRDTAGNGTTTLTDLSGTNDGTLVNMTPASDWVADTGAGGVRALDFDGVNDHVVAPRTANIVSVSTWVTVSGTSGDRRIFSINRNAFSMYSGNGVQTPRIVYNNSDLSSGITLNGSGAWNHVVASYDGTNVKCYHNGVLRSTNAVAAATLSTANVYISALEFGSIIQLWNGRQDDFRVFDVALDQSDVNALYATGLGRGVQA